MCQNHLVIRVLKAAEMREVDRLTTERYGIPSIILMENAARAVADAIEKRLGADVAGKSVAVLCGKGNNGGDGAAVARLLSQRGAIVNAFLFAKIEDTTGDARINFEALSKVATDSNRRIYIHDVSESGNWWPPVEEGPPAYDVIVDAILGTGISRPVEGVAKTGIELLRLAKHKTRESLFVAVDMPSGLVSDSQQLPEVHSFADMTVTFTAPKLANVLPPASRANGELIVADIGSPRSLFLDGDLCITEARDVRSGWLAGTTFTADSYKNKRGHALLVVGSRDYSGAAALAGNAAMRTGAGIVTVATTRSVQEAIAEKTLEEVITRGLSETADGKLAAEAFDEIEQLAAKADAIGIGCGLGFGDNRDRLRRFIETREMPIVVDADGLNALAPFDVVSETHYPQLVMTPHEGEFLRLLGSANRSVLDDRVGAVRDFAVKHNVILVLKGERVLIGDPSGRVVINPTGNSGLGKAGNGDNLTGIITGFLAQGAGRVNSIDSVVAAVYVAGRAGDIARERFGERVMLASDVRDSLAAAFAELDANG